jgi:molybdopterin molybdotransferase
MCLKNDFTKGSKGTRFIRGHLTIEDARAVFDAPYEQGNIVISSAVGCNCYGIIKEGSGPKAAGDIVEGFIIYDRL